MNIESDYVRGFHDGITESYKLEVDRFCKHFMKSILTLASDKEMLNELLMHAAGTLAELGLLNFDEETSSDE